MLVEKVKAQLNLDPAFLKPKTVGGSQAIP